MLYDKKNNIATNLLLKHLKKDKTACTRDTCSHDTRIMSLIFLHINLIVYSQRFFARAHICVHMCVLLLCRKSLCAMSALFQKQPDEMKAFARGVPFSRCYWKCLYVGPLCAFYVLGFTVALEFPCCIISLRTVSPHLSHIFIYINKERYKYSWKIFDFIWFSHNFATFNLITAICMNNKIKNNHIIYVNFCNK